MLLSSATESVVARRLFYNLLISTPPRPGGIVISEPNEALRPVKPDRIGDEPLFFKDDIVTAHLRPPTSSPNYLAEELADGVIKAVHQGRNGAQSTYDIMSIVYLNEYVDQPMGYRIPEEHLFLVRRGNPWRLAHGVPERFTSIADEAKFWINEGYAREIRHPHFTDKWTLPSLHKALRQRKIDTYRREDGFIRAYLFDDPSVGERVREFMLQRIERTT